MSKIRKVILGAFACIPILLVIYIAFTVHYTHIFMCGTWINGIYCTGFTAEECNELLMAEYQQDYIEIQDKSNVRYRISYEEIDGSTVGAGSDPGGRGGLPKHGGESDGESGSVFSAAHAR